LALTVGGGYCILLVKDHIWVRVIPKLSFETDGLSRGRYVGRNLARAVNGVLFPFPNFQSLYQMLSFKENIYDYREIPAQFY